MPAREYKDGSRPGPAKEETEADREAPTSLQRLQSFFADPFRFPHSFKIVMLLTSISAVLGALALARAQANEPGPRGVVIEGDYSGALRPQIHYSPPQGFMNDPNGMFVDNEGVWHLYYQCE